MLKYAILFAHMPILKTGLERVYGRDNPAVVVTEAS